MKKKKKKSDSSNRFTKRSQGTTPKTPTENKNQEQRRTTLYYLSSTEPRLKDDRDDDDDKKGLYRTPNSSKFDFDFALPIDFAFGPPSPFRSTNTPDEGVSVVDVRSVIDCALGRGRSTPAAAPPPPPLIPPPPDNEADADVLDPDPDKLAEPCAESKAEFKADDVGDVADEGEPYPPTKLLNAPTDFDFVSVWVAILGRGGTGGGAVVGVFKEGLRGLGLVCAGVFGGVGDVDVGGVGDREGDGDGLGL